MAFKKIQIQNVEYTFEHLNPFCFQVLAPDESELQIEVSFSNHVFSRERVEADTRDLWISDTLELRSFCFVRYPLSKGLPALIRAHANKKVYFTEKQAFMIVDSNTTPGPYCVFFDLEKTKARRQTADLKMMVVSAYPKQEVPALSKLGSIKLHTLAMKRMRGEHIRRPQR